MKIKCRDVKRKCTPTISVSDLNPRIRVTIFRIQSKCLPAWGGSFNTFTRTRVPHPPHCQLTAKHDLLPDTHINRCISYGGVQIWSTTKGTKPPSSDF